MANILAAHRSDKKKTPDTRMYRNLTLANVLAPDFGRRELFVKDQKGRMANVRRNGQVKTWKRDTTRVEIPVKFGMYEAFRVTDPSELYVCIEGEV
jgi:hypothetical protein